MKREDIVEAYLFLRRHNHSLPDDVLDFMKNASLKAYDEMMKESEPARPANVPAPREKNQATIVRMVEN